MVKYSRKGGANIVKYLAAKIVRMNRGVILLVSENKIHFNHMNTGKDENVR